MFKPYCAQCGSIKPGESSIDHGHCQPCLNTGHIHSLVSSESDRVRRFEGWTKFWDYHSYSQSDRVKVQPPVKRPVVKVAGNLQLATMRPVKVAKPKLRVKVN
jgi:hypothetical protein